MTDSMLALPISRESLLLATDPKLLHNLVVRHLPDMHGRSQAIRADTETLVRLDLPTDPLGIRGKIAIRFRGPFSPLDASPVEQPALRDGSRVVLRLATQARRTTDGARTRRSVDDDEVDGWVGARLSDAGLATTDLRISPGRVYGKATMGTYRDCGHIGFVVRDIAATVRVVDLERAALAMRTGIGRGRAYGLGMLVVTKNL